RRFGSRLRKAVPGGAAAATRESKAGAALTGFGLVGKLAALSIAALSWGLVNFGLLLWLPADFVARGYSMEVSSKLLAESTLIAFPTVFAAAWLYSKLSSKWSVIEMVALTLLGFAG